MWDIVDSFYKAFGFELEIRLSFHDPENMSAYLGTALLWEEAENALRAIADDRKVKYKEVKGEAAFYGPKIDFMTHDSLGREWQVATIQLDVNMPDRFDLSCVNEQGEKERIVMIHCAIMGSIERFMSILIEHYAGVFPVWLSPVQVSVLPISDNQLELADTVWKALTKAGIRAEVNRDSKTLGAKIRESTLQKVPFMVIIGEKEQQASGIDVVVSVRSRDSKDGGTQKLVDFISTVRKLIETYQ